MKPFFSSYKLFILGFIIIAVTNLFVLTGVAFNKKGPKEALITLTERELKHPYRTNRENSGLTLNISWQSLGTQTYNIYGWNDPLWLNGKKLKELGFDVNMDRHKRMPSKEVFVVLEYDGDSYRKALKNNELNLKKMQYVYDLNKKDREAKRKLESATKYLKRQQLSLSRLFAIDAGVDPEKLRKIYNNRAQFIITRAQIKPVFNTARGEKEVTGHVQKLSIGNIHVPLKHCKTLKDMLADTTSKGNYITPPRYAVTLAYGSRFEPWIISIQNL